eukprot:g5073.t1
MSTRHLLIHIPERWNSTSSTLEENCDHFYECYWYYLCAVYGAVGVVALIQLIRIQMRVPDFGWTTQKVFHLLNFIVCLLRALTFGLHSHMKDLYEAIDSHSLQIIILELPSLLFFTTYSLLVLFWAEIYHQANAAETRKLRPYFLLVNLVIYVIQAILWLATLPHYSRETDRNISAVWLSIVFLVAAIGFLIYGGCLFHMLSKFPIASRGRKRKLQEVGGITIICSIAFIARSAFMFMFVLDDDDFDIDLLEDDFLNIIFYTICELIPTISVLFILRKLPPKRSKLDSSIYAPIEDQVSMNE